MTYTSLSHYQVLQRDANNTAQVRLEDGQILELPVGGPYTVGKAQNILVGDIWLLAGQSNMEGVGDLVDVEKPSPFVHSFQSREEWAIAEEPLHWLDESPRLVHHLLRERQQVPNRIPQRDPNRLNGAGLALTFAKERYIRTGIPVGLIPCAHGGTSMQQWDPRKRDEGDASLYGALLKRFEKIGGKIAGMLWYQGEGDATTEDAELYHQRMDALLHSLRSDLQHPSLPFYYVQIGRYVYDATANPGWSAIREAQRTWHIAHPDTAMVSAIDLELDDFIHIGTQGLKRLGRRLADCADGLRAPVLASVALENDPARIRLTFSNVRGGLHSPGLPAGFSLHTSDGTPVPAIYKITLNENTVLLHLTPDALPGDTTLWYGYGANPYCNIHDATDAAIPAFGPVMLL